MGMLSGVVSLGYFRGMGKFWVGFRDPRILLQHCKELSPIFMFPYF